MVGGGGVGRGEEGNAKHSLLCTKTARLVEALRQDCVW